MSDVAYIHVSGLCVYFCVSMFISGSAVVSGV